MTPKSGVMFLKNSPLCRGHVSEKGVGNVSEKHALKWGHDPDKSHPADLRSLLRWCLLAQLEQVYHLVARLLRADRNMEIDRRRVQAPMAQKDLNRAQIDSSLEQARSKTVSHRVRRNPFV